MKSNIIRIFVVAISAAFFITTAAAQNAGTVTSHAFAVGKGAGKQGFTSLLCASAQLAVGQSAADPICQTLSGDVTINASGVTAVGANKITLGMMATLAADRLIMNATGSTATPQSVAIGNCANALTYSTSSHAFGCNVSAGTGTVTSIGLTNTYGLSVSGSPVTTNGNISAGVALTTATNSLGANVAFTATASYANGPSVAQGVTGTFEAFGTISLQGGASGDDIFCKLWDGTTTIASTGASVPSASYKFSLSISGVIASPAGNIRIDCRNSTSNSGSMLFNSTGNSKDSTVTVVRIQ